MKLGFKKCTIALNDYFSIKLAIAGLIASSFVLGLGQLSTDVPWTLAASVAYAQSPIIVNSTEATVSNDDLCTLREALVNANRNEKYYVDCKPGIGADVIAFKIPGPGPHTIHIQKGFNLVVTDPVFIDGLSQAANGVSPSNCGKKRNLLVNLNGASADEVSGITILKTSNVTIRGLAIGAFRGAGIQIRNSQNVHILCNHIGTDIAAENAVPNQISGIQISNKSQAVTIGTDGDGADDKLEFNVISGNGGPGILMSNSHKNVIAGNRIGTDMGGLSALANIGSGIMVGKGSQFNRIGTNADHVNDAHERNIISGNTIHGITISDPDTKKNSVTGNYIGTNFFGSRALPNLVAGINIVNGVDDTRIGGAKKPETNIISGNKSRGIWIHSTYDAFLDGNGAANTKIQNNVIGLDVNGQPMGNKNHGVLLELAANVELIDNNISNNRLRGIYIIGSEAMIINNRIKNNGRSGIEIFYHPGATASARDESIRPDDVVSSILSIGNFIEGNCLSGRRCAGIMGTDDSVDPGDSTKGKTLARSNIIKTNNGHPDVAQYWYAVVEGLTDMQPYTDTLKLMRSDGRTSYRLNSSGKPQKYFGNKILYGPADFDLTDITTWQLLPDYIINEDGEQIEFSYSALTGTTTKFDAVLTKPVDYTKNGFLRSGIISNIHTGYRTANKGFGLMRYKILTLR